MKRLFSSLRGILHKLYLIFRIILIFRGDVVDHARYRVFQPDDISWSFFLACHILTLSGLSAGIPFINTKQLPAAHDNLVAFFCV